MVVEVINFDKRQIWSKLKEDKVKTCVCSLAGTEACEKCLKTHNETPFFNNYKPDFFKKITDGVMDLPNPYSYILDKKVFQLAQKIKDDNIQLYQDYKNGHHTLDFFKGCTIDSVMILDYMAQIWDVNLDEYYIEVEY
jgi:hypothetical protein